MIVQKPYGGRPTFTAMAVRSRDRQDAAEQAAAVRQDAAEQAAAVRQWVADVAAALRPEFDRAVEAEVDRRLAEQALRALRDGLS